MSADAWSGAQRNVARSKIDAPMLRRPAGMFEDEALLPVCWGG